MHLKLSKNLTNDILHENSGVFYTVYLDDILIFSKLLSDYEEHVYWVPSKLLANYLSTKQPECTISLDAIEYSGYVLNSKGVLSNPSKVSFILERLLPT